MVVCRIDESLCRVDDGTDTEEPTITYERCDTRASGKPAVPYTHTHQMKSRCIPDGCSKIVCVYLNYVYTAETMSNISISYQPSISEHVAPEPERRGSGEGPFDQLGKPQESLVLQLYGISKPC